MKRLFVLLIISCTPLGYGYGTGLYSLDSLGVTQKGSDKFVIHEVDAGETLFALSRKYNVSVQQIRNANEVNLSSLNVGQKVFIPVQALRVDDSSIIHTVKSSETLFSISRNYNVKVDELKAWNELSDNSISIGQKLIIKKSNAQMDASVKPVLPETSNRKKHIVKESQTLYSISRMYGVSTEQIKAWNQLASSSLSIGQELIVSGEKISKPQVESHSSMLPPTERSSTNTPLEDKDHGMEVKKNIEKESAAESKTFEAPEKIQAPAEKVTERGIAEVIKDTENTKKYLAMHRSAPIGTIMQVRNEMNDQTVFVRVVGPIQPTGDNEKLVLLISKKAYDRLGAVDSRFPVEISYIP